MGLRVPRCEDTALAGDEDPKVADALDKLAPAQPEDPKVNDALDKLRLEAEESERSEQDQNPYVLRGAGAERATLNSVTEASFLWSQAPGCYQHRRGHLFFLRPVLYYTCVIPVL